MLFRFPKDDKNFSWTSHVKNKMIQYRLSEQKIKTVLNNPARKEVGIAQNTSAFMKRNDTPKRKEEIWIMFQKKPKVSAVTIISAWRYPGISPMGKEIPIPEDILNELESIE